jgi:hypothetical protein
MLTLNYKYLAHGNKFVFQAFVGRGVGMRELGASGRKISSEKIKHRSFN